VYVIVITHYYRNKNNASISIAQNKLSSASLTADQTVFSLPTKVCRVTDADQMSVDELFHTRRSATAKLRVPSKVLVLWTTRHWLSADWR